MALYPAHYMTRHYIVVTTQMLDILLCVQQSSYPIWSEAIDIVQITLGTLMCSLVVTQFIREALQMYKATKHVRLNRYMSLLVREAIFYFLGYVPRLGLQ